MDCLQQISRYIRERYVLYRVTCPFGHRLRLTMEDKDCDLCRTRAHSAYICGQCDGIVVCGTCRTDRIGVFRDLIGRNIYDKHFLMRCRQGHLYQRNRSGIEQCVSCSRTHSIAWFSCTENTSNQGYCLGCYRNMFREHMDEIIRCRISFISCTRCRERGGVVMVLDRVNSSRSPNCTMCDRTMYGQWTYACLYHRHDTEVCGKCRLRHMFALEPERSSIPLRSWIIYNEGTPRYFRRNDTLCQPVTSEPRSLLNTATSEPVDPVTQIDKYEQMSNIKQRLLEKAKGTLTQEQLVCLQQDIDKLKNEFSPDIRHHFVDWVNDVERLWKVADYFSPPTVSEPPTQVVVDPASAITMLTCSICMEGLKTHRFGCGHMFCHNCVYKGTQTCDLVKCPLCRKNVFRIDRVYF
jgi:hypothetical protein